MEKSHLPNNLILKLSWGNISCLRPILIVRVLLLCWTQLFLKLWVAALVGIYRRTPEKGRGKGKSYFIFPLDRRWAWSFLWVRHPSIMPILQALCFFNIYHIWNKIKLNPTILEGNILQKMFTGSTGSDAIWSQKIQCAQLKDIQSIGWRLLRRR